ncbi:MAG: aspartate dehydrogenase [Alphaproteobacteria bacterium]|nr:MAG: aspartate dehydrogenase [Alphaproteobacteria bacterium]
MLKVGLIGIGAISQCVIDTLPKVSGKEIEIVGVLVRPETYADIVAKVDGRLPIYQDLKAFLAAGPDIVAECAGHGAVQAYGEEILLSGTSLLIISVGALANEELAQRLKAAAKFGGCKIHLPSGAIGGIDALASAKLGGLNRVCYRARKPAKAWIGSEADKEFDLLSLTKPTVIFTGNARQAALLYPKNSNVAATVALAGLGFEATDVELVADPNITENIHEIEVDGASGRFNISLVGNPSTYNPKTSALTAFSVARTLAALDASIVI